MTTPLDSNLLLLLGLSLAACSPAARLNAHDAADANDTGNAVGAKDASERSLLDRLPTLPSGRPERVGKVSVTAEVPYSAASGRTCRALSISSELNRGAIPRLACTKGGAWFFVPEVFVTSLAE